MLFNPLRKKIEDKWFYFPIIILAIFLIIRLIDMSKMIWIYPFDKNMDLGAYMALFYIVTKYGFHQFVSIWCNGFILFQIYYPAWFYFTLPIYYIIQNISITVYASLLLIYLLIFILIYILGKFHNFSKIKRIAFFFFLVANPITLGYILRIGRITEFFSWMVFILLFMLIIKYKDKPFDKYFLFFIPIYSVLLLSHYSAFLISTSFIFSLCLIRNKFKEVIYIATCILLFLAITAFWWIPFIKNIINTSTATQFSLQWLISSLHNTFMDKISTIIIPLIFLIISFFYFSDKYKSKREFLFFLPQLLLAILILFRILPFIPIYNRITPDSYNILFIFLSLFLFFKTNFTKFIKKVVIFLLFLLPIMGIIINITFTPTYSLYSDEDKDVLDLLKYVDGPLLIYEPEERESYTYYGYATIYYNISTPFSGTPALLTKEIEDKRKLTITSLNNEDCITMSKTFKELAIKNVIATKEKCEKLNRCNFIIKKQNKTACLYYLK